MRILCLGAHSDDLEIGCGGTLLRLLAEREAAVRWVVLGCSGQRLEEARQSAESLLEAAREKRVEIRWLPGRVPSLPGRRDQRDC